MILGVRQRFPCWKAFSIGPYAHPDRLSIDVYACRRAESGLIEDAFHQRATARISRRPAVSWRLAIGWRLGRLRANSVDLISVTEAFQAHRPVSIEYHCQAVGVADGKSSLLKVQEPFTAGVEGELRIIQRKIFSVELPIGITSVFVSGGDDRTVRVWKAAGHTGDTLGSRPGGPVPSSRDDLTTEVYAVAYIQPAQIIVGTQLGLVSIRLSSQT